MKSIDELGISPAPWRIGEEDCDGIVEDIMDSGFGDESIAGLVVYDGCMDKADARLIAAAPELYECLRKVVNDVVCRCATKDCDKCNMALCWVKKAKAVLAKASGEVA